MTLRDAIRAALSGGDASELRDVPADEVGQALASYADTSSLAEADALAPIVTRASPVPFDNEIDGDLGAPLIDVQAEIDSLDIAMVSADADVDPSEGIDGQPVAAGIDDDDRDPGDLFGTGAHADAVISAEMTTAASPDDFGAGRIPEDADAVAAVSANAVETDPMPGFDEPEIDAINDLTLEDDGLVILTSSDLDDDLDVPDDAGDSDVDA